MNFEKFIDLIKYKLNFYKLLYVLVSFNKKDLVL